MGNLTAARRERSTEDAEPRPRLADRVASINPVLRQPNTWTGVLVLALAMVVVWQHPISQRLGTASASEPASTATAAPATAGASDVALTSTAAPPLPGHHGRSSQVVIHAPRDPFRALVTPDGAARAPVTIQLPHARRPAAGPKPTGGHGTSNPGTSNPGSSKPGSSTAGTSVGRCAAVHVVQPGESLWSIAQGNLAKLGYRSVTPAWHAVYTANRKAIGSSPGSLAVGTKLCLPAA